MSDYQDRGSRGGGWIYWVIAIMLLVTGFAAPIGFLMIVIRLLGGTKRGTKRGRHPYYAQQAGQGPVGARTSAPYAEQEPAATGKKKTPRSRKASVQDQISQLNDRAKKMTIIGGILAALFGFASLTAVSSSLWILPDVAWFLEETLPVVCCFFGGLGCLWVGVHKRKQANRYRSYVAMIGSNKSVSIASLASATGRSVGRVRDDLEDMLEDGMFPQGYLDYGAGTLVLSGGGISSKPEEPAQPKKPAKEEAKQEQDAILLEIKAVNDAIDNEKLSAQIDRIGVITAKILDYQRQHPDKSPQLHSFLSYYLPTTLKILRAYSQLEDQEVSGENITSAMARIEGMMDKVVEGFEKQLDQLFQGDAMDITTDVEVLERMLAKDGLADHQGMTLNL